MRRLILLVGAIVLVDTMFYSAITPLLPLYANRFDLSKSASGILAGAYAAGTLVGSLPSGWLAARVGAQRAVVLGVALMSLASLGFAFGHDIVLLDVTRFVQGLGGACSWAGAMGWLLSSTPASQRGQAIGAAMGTAVGGALLGPVLGAIARGVGPEPAFSTVAVLGGVLIVAALRMPAPPVATGGGESLLASLRERRVRGGMVLVTVPSLVFGTLNVLAPLRLDHLGASGFAIGATFLVAAAIEAVGQAFVGRLADRRGRRAPILAGLAIAVVLMLLLPLPASAALLAPLVVVAAVGVGTLYTPAMALLSDGAEAAGLDQGLGFALVNLTWSGGQVVGAVVGSGLAGATSDAVPYVLLALLCGATLAALLRQRAPLAAPG
ncbi:MAG: transporter [Conexibacter sp.]|nr:transporter [Conexibacter sp.]